MRLLYKKQTKNKEYHISLFNKGFIFGYLRYINKKFNQEFIHTELFIGCIQIDIYDFK